MSDTERQRRALQLCDAALAQPGTRRETFLVEACAGDPALRHAVDSILGAVTQAEGFLERDTSELIATARVGSTIGRYTLVSVLGAGGMGIVYLAERREAGYAQRVAIKLVRANLAARELLARFESERRVLAGLNHPYIAGLIDAGTTDQGVPYLVMEYVEGTPIDRYCDERRLDVPARVRLLIKVSMAVQAAHQSLVIHRDLKPNNVLITADGLPKLLDFGIAKLTLPADSDSPDTGAATLFGQRALTPNYASPEQILEGRITTASDVYSLGVMAYELLSGELPYLLDTSSQRALIRATETLSVPRPSLRASQSRSSGKLAVTAAERGTTPNRLLSALAGDLDNILLMALRQEPERRYTTAAQFAEDLARYLDRRPVAARSDRLGYRTARLLRRHWLPASASAAVMISLIAGVISFAWQADQARHERDRTQQVNNFLQSILTEADPYAAGADASIRDVLRKADGMIADRFAQAPDLEASIRRTVGYTQLGLLDLDAAESNLSRAHALNLQLYGYRDQRSLQTRADLAWTAFRQGDLAAAGAGYEIVASQLHPQLPASFRATILNDHGVVLLELGDYARAAALFREVLAMQPVLDLGPAQHASTANNIAAAYHDLGDAAQAEHWYRESIAIGRAQPGADSDPNLAIHLNNLAVLLRDEHHADEALALFREALEIRINALGLEHGFTGYSRLQLGRQLLDMDALEPARAQIVTGLEISRATLPQSSPQVLLARALAARLAIRDGDESFAIAELEAAARAAADSGYTSLEGLFTTWRDKALETALPPGQGMVPAR